MEHHSRDIYPATPAKTTLYPGLVLKLAREERAFLSKLAQNMISQPRVRIQPFVDSLSPNRSWTYEHVRISSHERIAERIVFHQDYLFLVVPVFGELHFTPQQLIPVMSVEVF